MSPRTKRWEQTDEQIREEWNKIFQGKVNEFKEKWSVHYQDVIPEQTDEWEEPLMEPLMITFKCKECSGHVWSKQGLVNLYFRRNQLNKDCDQEANGDVLIWLQSQPCPNCSSIQRPAMSVKQKEMDAVLSYLKMEIGWYYYKIEYTKDEERQIEEIRKIKKRTTKEVKILDNDSIKVVVTSKAKESVGNDSFKVFGHAQQDVTTIQPDLRPVVPIINQDKPTKAEKKKITQWDKTSDEIRKEWQDIFDSKFEKFITEKEPHDRWTLQLNMPKKNNSWDRFLGETATVNFKCLKCGKIWDSMRGWIACWIWKSRLGSDGKLKGGKVSIHILKQKCSRCPGFQKSKSYDDVEVDVYGDEIEAVLSYLLMDIDYWLYGNEEYTEFDEEEIGKKRTVISHGVPKWRRRGNKSIRHQMENCQACERNVCNKHIVGKWDELSVTPVFYEGTIVRDDLIPVFGNPAKLN